MSTEFTYAASEQPAERLCTACFTGRYPVGLPEAIALTATGPLLPALLADPDVLGSVEEVEESSLLEPSLLEPSLLEPRVVEATVGGTTA